jgi:D-alanine-D-alanine ligase
MKSIVILAGGTSSERAVSLRSGAAVQTALQKLGYQTIMLDPREELESQLDTLRAADAIFPILHGKDGEDGVLQGQLKAWGLHRYVGSDPASSALCFDKTVYKAHVGTHGLPVPRGAVVTEEQLWQSPYVTKAFVLKPFDGGSTIDAFIVRDPAKSNKAAIADAFTRHETMLVEELISGVEITVGVLGDQALPVIEIVPPEGGEFDYENKYNGKTRELCPPEHVNDEAQKAAQALALKAHRVCGCRDLSRTDIIVQPSGKLCILETNTLPGMTDQSLYPKAAARADISMTQLIDRLVGYALAR